MNDVSQKLDLILGEQKNLRFLIDRVEVNILDEVGKVKKEVTKLKGEMTGVKQEVAKNTRGISKVAKEIKGVKDTLVDHKERIASLENHCSPTLA